MERELTKAAASRYSDRRGRVPIGPELFPVYRFTMRAILGVWVMLRVIGALLALRGTPNAGSILRHLSRDIMFWGLLNGTGVTGVFTVWE